MARFVKSDEIYGFNAFISDNDQPVTTREHLVRVLPELLGSDEDAVTIASDSPQRNEGIWEIQPPTEWVVIIEITGYYGVENSPYMLEIQP